MQPPLIAAQVATFRAISTLVGAKRPTYGNYVNFAPYFCVIMTQRFCPTGAFHPCDQPIIPLSGTAGPLGVTGIDQ